MVQSELKQLGIFGQPPIPLAFGLLRLGIEGRPDEEDAIQLIHQALDLGIRILDTADSYCLHDKDFHYGERLACRALKTWNGPRQEVHVLTKVGLTRPKGKWVPDGSRSHLEKAVRGSLDALEVDSLPYLQLHVKDPRVPFEETLATLADLRERGLVDKLGLCNVEPFDIRQAQRHFPVDWVQNELSVMSRSSATDGTLELARQMGIPFLAYRPLGGQAKVVKLDTNRTLGPIAKRLQIAAPDLALAVVQQAGPHVVPLIGATRIESLQASVQAMQLVLEAEDKLTIDTKCSFAPSESALRAIAPRIIPPHLPRLLPGAGPGEQPEVVLLMGIQGAGKSELVQSYTQRGYVRLNRDSLGGSMDEVVELMTQKIDEGEQRIVLDNTYPTRASRAAVIDAAHYFGLPVRCRWLMTSLADARINIVHRLLARYGKLLGPQEMKEYAKQDSNLPPPIALQRWVESFEPPELDEGFSAVDRIPFQRRPDAGLRNRAVFLDVDGTLRRTKSQENYPRSPDDIEILPGRTEVLKRWRSKGFKLLLVSNQSGIASGKLGDAEALACFERTKELLNVEIDDVVYCPHSAFPVGCFCRKPLPGLGIELMVRHQLDLQQCFMVGDLESDRQFAESLSVHYIDADRFFDRSFDPIEFE